MHARGDRLGLRQHAGTGEAGPGAAGAAARRAGQAGEAGQAAQGSGSYPDLPALSQHRLTRSLTSHAHMFYIAHMTEVEHAVPGAVPEFDINDRLRKAREVTGLSQAEMARELGVARTSIVTYETGRKKPTRPVVPAWSFRTRVPYQWICHGDTLPGGPQGRRSDGFATKMHKLPTRGAA